MLVFGREEAPSVEEEFLYAVLAVLYSFVSMAACLVPGAVTGAIHALLPSAKLRLGLTPLLGGGAGAVWFLLTQESSGGGFSPLMLSLGFHWWIFALQCAGSALVFAELFGLLSTRSRQAQVADVRVD